MTLEELKKLNNNSTICPNCKEDLTKTGIRDIEHVDEEVYYSMIYNKDKEEFIPIGEGAFDGDMWVEGTTIRYECGYCENNIGSKETDFGDE